MMRTQVFKPACAITFATARADRIRLLDNCKSNSSGELVIDLSDVIQCDSAGLALLIESKRLCKAYNQSCRIVGMSPAILSLAEFCGVKDILA